MQHISRICLVKQAALTFEATPWQKGNRYALVCDPLAMARLGLDSSCGDAGRSMATENKQQEVKSNMDSAHRLISQHETLNLLNSYAQGNFFVDDRHHKSMCTCFEHMQKTF